MEEQLEAMALYVADCVAEGMSADEVTLVMNDDEDCGGCCLEANEGSSSVFIESEGVRYRVTVSVDE